MTTCPNNSKKLTGKHDLPPEEVVFLKRVSFGIAAPSHYTDDDIGDLAAFRKTSGSMQRKVNAWLKSQFDFKGEKIEGIQDPSGFITLGLNDERMGPKNMRNIVYDLNYQDYLIAVKADKVDEMFYPKYGTFVNRRKRPLNGWTTLGYNSSQELTYLKLIQQKAQPADEMSILTFQRAVYSKYQLFERLTMFWKDHFNIFRRTAGTGLYMGSWDSAIRPHITGNFYKLLLATAEHPAMLKYLDNSANRAGEPNENYAREVIELHTLGDMHYHGLISEDEVPKFSNEFGSKWNGLPQGYIDSDVYSSAEMLAGWHVTGGGDFAFKVDAASKNEINILGHKYPRYGIGSIYQSFGGQDGRHNQGRHLLHTLATHPATAKHIAYKLVKHFLSDHPPSDLINKVRDTFLANVDKDDQLEQCYLTLFSDPLMRDPKTWGEKKCRPYEQIVQACRTMGCQKNFYRGGGVGFLVGFKEFYQTGNQLHEWGSPDGQPHDSEHWLGTDNMAMTLRLIDTLTRDWYEHMGTYTAGSTDEKYKKSFMRVIQITVDHFRTSDNPEITPRNVVNFWANRVWGFIPSDREALPLIDFFCEPQDSKKQDGTRTWGKDEPIGTEFLSYRGNHIWLYRLRVMIFLLMTHPYGMLR